MNDVDYRALFELSNDAVVLVDTEKGCYLDANAAAESLTGRSRRELVGLPTRKVTPEGVSERLELARSADSAREVGEVKYHRPDGSIRIALVTVVPAAPGMVFAVAKDITERRRIERELEAEKEHFKHLFQSSPVAVLVLDSEDRVVDCNYEFTRLFGYSAHETLGRHLNDLITTPEMIDEAQRLSTQTLSGQPIYVETRRRRKDGTLVDVAITGAPRDIKGWRYVYGIYQDITERKEAEAQVSALLREKELLLRETHHRIKNNMGVISGLLSIQASLHEGTESEAVLQDAAARVQSMLVLYTKLYEAPSVVALSVREYLPALVDDIISLFRDTVPVQTELELDDFTVSPQALAPFGIIINELITNSIKYAFKWRSDGVIRIEARVIEQAPQQIRLIYQDNGIGLPSDVSLTSSSGFGLELVGMLVEQLSGTARIESSTEGSRFVFEFSL